LTNSESASFFIVEFILKEKLLSLPLHNTDPLILGGVLKETVTD